MSIFSSNNNYCSRPHPVGTKNNVCVPTWPHSSHSLVPWQCLDLSPWAAALPAGRESTLGFLVCQHTDQWTARRGKWRKAYKPPAYRPVGTTRWGKWRQAYKPPAYRPVESEEEDKDSHTSIQTVDSKRGKWRQSYKSRLNLYASWAT